MTRQVVITGVGVVSPLGVSFPEFARRLFDCESGVRPVTRFDASRFGCRWAAEVDDGAFQQAHPLRNHEISRMGRFVRLALASAHEALSDSRVHAPDAAPDAGGLFVGVAMGGLPEMEAGVLRQAQRGPRKTQPYLIPSLIPNMAASQIALQNHIQGPQYTLAGACASGIQALGQAASAIRRGELRWALAGGAEAVVTPITFSGFEAMRALSTAAEPHATPRPFDREGDGMIVGEGAAFFVLEDASHAAARKREVYGRLRGHATTSRGDRLTLQSAAAAADCMRLALLDAGVQTEEIGAAFAQATGLRAGDEQELQAFQTVFAPAPRSITLTSIKGQIGHTFGASGPLGLAAALEALRRQRVPATRNFRSTLPERSMLDIASQARERELRHCLINSFGFGGINACLVASHPDAPG